MLNRREFLKLSTVLAAGAVVALSSADKVLGWGNHPSERPIMRHHGHGKSGCSFRPELVDLWTGGGAQLPDMV